MSCLCIILVYHSHINTHAQYTYYSRLFVLCLLYIATLFHTFISSVVVAVIINSLATTQLNSKGYMCIFLEISPITASCLILSDWSQSSSSEDLRPAMLFIKDSTIHSQTHVTRIQADCDWFRPYIIYKATKYGV